MEMRHISTQRLATGVTGVGFVCTPFAIVVGVPAAIVWAEILEPAGTMGVTGVATAVPHWTPSDGDVRAPLPRQFLNLT